MRLSWSKLLSEKRLEGLESAEEAIARPSWLFVSRTDHERDGDRILFAAPTRRLGDKTQVFPLEKLESVRTRLTHSHEVASLARSIGTHIVSTDLGRRIAAEADAERAGAGALVARSVPAMLASVGLAHDLGNPPFGHQGEGAIREWVARNASRVFKAPENAPDAVRRDVARLEADLQADFLRFEGNAQTLRTVARLQLTKDPRGLNLTFGTLAALLKYPVSASRVGPKDGPAAARKLGVFASERPLLELVHEHTGLVEGVRHPLTWLMEACDDIAYSVVDAEDAVKKQIASFHDLAAWLRGRQETRSDEGALWALEQTEADVKDARAHGLSPAEVNDVAMQIFRSRAIHVMISAAIDAFETNYERIMTGTLEKPLVEASRATGLCDALKAFDKEHAYRNRRVLEIELNGFNVINGLMDMLWRGVTERNDYADVASARTTPFARYAYGRISENYRRAFEGGFGRQPGYGPPDLPIRYRELQLLTDMISGMTDQFAIDLFAGLREFHVGASEPAA